MIVEKHSRMPRKYESEPETEAPSKLDPSNLPALRDTDPQEILLRYLSDESTKDIAATYGVTRQALGKYLLKVAETDWKEAQVARAIARKEAAEDALEAAKDPMQLAKARELFKAAAWDLERTGRRIYGDELQTEKPITPILNIVIANGPEEQRQMPRHVRVSLARMDDATQQYDSGAPQQEAVIDAPPVDK